VIRYAPWFGILGGAAWIGLGLGPPECVPVTGASEVFCNRLWTAPLAAMFVSSLILFRSGRPPLGRLERIGLGSVVAGFGLMALGNGGEYWLAFQLPHQGPMGFVRGFLWMGLLAGWFATIAGSTVLGVGLLRHHAAPTWLGLALGVAVPLTIGLVILAAPTIPVGLVGLSVGLVGFAARGRA